MKILLQVFVWIYVYCKSKTVSVFEKMSVSAHSWGLKEAECKDLDAGCLTDEANDK